MSFEIQNGWQALCRRWERFGYASLSDAERTWLNCRLLIDSVENGGLISYFYNSGADTLADCLTALRRLDAAAVLACVERVAVLFGPEVPPAVEERNRIINTWPDGDPRDTLLEETDRELMPLVRDLDAKLEAFVARHVLPGRG